MGSRARALAQNLGLSLASVAAVLGVWLLVELALRAADPRYLDRFARDDMSYLHEYSDRYGWQPRAGFAMTGGGPRTSINSLGYRGPEHRHARVPGKRRIVMLGDSLTFGYGVPDGETFSDRLEQIDPTLEVVNLGVQGYGTDQELLKLEAEGFAYLPDIVMLNFCLANDFRDNGATHAIYDGAYPKPYFTLEGERLVLHDEGLRLSPLASLAFFLNQRSVVYNWLQQKLRPTRAAGDDEDQVTPPARAVTLALLRRMAEVARSHRVRLMVLVYPNYREFLKPTRRGRVISEAPGLDDVLRVEMLPRFEARGFTRDSYDRYALDGTLHLSAAGHALVAGIIHEILAEDAREPAPPPPGPGAAPAPPASRPRSPAGR